MNTCSLFYWQKLDQAPCTRQSTGLSQCSKQPQTWLEQCLHRHCQTCLLSLEIYLLSTIYSIYTMYLISTYGLILELPEEVVSPREPRLCFTSLESWPGDLVTMGPWSRCPHVSCHTGAGLRTRRWTGGDWWRAGAGPRRHRPLLRCTVTPAYTALALSTLHYWYTLHYGALIGGLIIS